MSITRWTSVDGSLAVIASNWTVANAVCPSLARTSGDTDGHRRQCADPGEGVVDPTGYLGRIDSPGGAEDDLGVVARLGREALGEKALGLLGLAFASEVVLEAGPDRGGHRNDGDDTDDPAQENRSSAVVAPQPNTAEHVGTALRSCFHA